MDGLILAQPDEGALHLAITEFGLVYDAAHGRLVEHLSHCHRRFHVTDGVEHGVEELPLLVPGRRVPLSSERRHGGLPSNIGWTRQAVDALQEPTFMALAP
jgi:hypothetical protein